MTDYSPLKKAALSFCCAFLLLIYVPLASVVGTDAAEDIDCCAQAQNACTHADENGEICENCIHPEENFSDFV